MDSLANAGDGNVKSPRRSGRARVSTTMTIDGHTILRKNNYSVTGLNYVYHDFVPDEPTRPKPVQKKKNDDNVAPKPKKPRVESAATIGRRDHNQTVLAKTQPKDKLRAAFLARHVGILEPFCEPRVIQDLKNNASAAAKMVADVAQPKMIRATLRPYQMKGLEFMVRMHRQNLSMILGDEMGLGKTLQTISLLCHLKEQEQATGPSLIICPLSVLSSWCTEMQKWAPNLKYFQLHASNQDEQARQKQELADHATEYDVILTTYEMAKLPTLTSFYQRMMFHYVVLDEGHKIKGHQTLIAQAVRKIHAGNKLLLTGTPLQNNLVELWSLLNFLYPEVFTTLEPFQEHFDLNENILDKKFLIKTQHLLEIFMLRRLKKQVETLLPPKLETKVYCPLSQTQRFWYKALLMKDVSSLANMQETDEPLGTQRHSVLRSLFMQLRKCCNHPFLFEGAETDPNQTSLEDLVAASGKLAVLDMLLLSLFKKGNRCVLFTQFTMLLNLIEDYCILRGWKYCRLDGSTERARRNYLITRFNEPNSPYSLFLMSTRSGGMGLNLQTADTCILFDSDWNPQSDIQAMGRVHRIGQTKTVHVYRLISSGTVEERMLQRAEKKLLLEMVNRESKENNNMEDSNEDMARGMSSEELLQDIQFGCEAIFGNSASSNNELPTWKDIDNITDRARKESDSIGKLQGNTALSAKSYDVEKTFSNSQQFGGTDFQSLRQAMEKEELSKIPKNLQNIAYLWKDIQALEKKRIRKSRLVMIDGKGSGYGMSSVPVLASNNYELQNGESSVFDRELRKDSKSNFEVKKRKKGAQHEHQDFCQVCGDGGTLVLCPRCPCSVHLQCIGVKHARYFRSCTHHRCWECRKDRASAGGILYPCQSCALSYCEDCLPKEGVRFLDNVPRFDAMGFDSTKHVVYIHCSEMCENYAKAEYGYKPPKSRSRASLPPRLKLAHNFGGNTAALDDAAAQVDAQKKAAFQEGRRTRQGVMSTKAPPPPKPAVALVAVKKVRNPSPKQFRVPLPSSFPKTSAGAPIELLSSSSDEDNDQVAGEPTGPTSRVTPRVATSASLDATPTKGRSLVTPASSSGDDSSFCAAGSLMDPISID